VQLERAKQLLTETNLPVPDVARRCGFRYPTRFTDTFSKTFGRPPSEYRQCFTRVRLAEVEM
jgi:transcriptional regulator GlxA family with amidase domain